MSQQVRPLKINLRNWLISLGLIVLVYIIMLIGSELQPHDLRSLSKEHYDQELLRWGAGSAAEYEMVVDYKVRGPYAGRWTLRVKYGEVEILGSTITYDQPVSASDLKFLTVEGMFADIVSKRALLQSSKVSNDIDDSLDYKVRFNPDLGYPMLYEANPRGNVYDLDWHIQVEQLTVLKRSTPVP